ncbi:hypothetical protein EV643_113138 [Kribbella sp. VKM Ac-2527]|uniref:N-acetyltransferase domain-containing protein n=1 Tax=Kribbella caucasensis TaxID=2512215 RepID=A0A4V3C9F5_9ACTN|nr:GNAT family N-acetyltransferase [Kribbella sp. VKM Ac-2527]TDO45365.1 hypothetical protein EV643_113138 [Kribbella sp. VKM Ac-2527]
MENEFSVVDATSHSRYEARDGADALMGFVNYRRTDSAIIFLHAETLPEFQGRGVAGQIAAKSLADARAAGLRIKPACPYYIEYLKKHPEYDDLVDEVHHR